LALTRSEERLIKEVETPLFTGKKKSEKKAIFMKADATSLYQAHEEKLTSSFAPSFAGSEKMKK
jgi:hypothetical protein